MLSSISIKDETWINNWFAVKAAVKKYQEQNFRTLLFRIITFYQKLTAFLSPFIYNAWTRSIQGGLMWSKDQTGSLLIMRHRVEITITPEVSGSPAFNDSLLKIHTWSAQTDTCSLCVSWQQRQERLCVEGGKEKLAVRTACSKVLEAAIQQFQFCPSPLCEVFLFHIKPLLARSPCALSTSEW